MSHVLRRNPRHRCHLISTPIRFFPFSTATPATVDPPRPPSLNRRILLVRNPTAPVVSIIEEWRRRGGEVHHVELRKLIRLLRIHRRFIQALEVSEWMGRQNGYVASGGDAAVRIDLIRQVGGLENAVDYFHRIPEALRGMHVYGALLNCYANGKCLPEAEAVMRKMKESGFLKTSLPFNVMLKFYSEVGMYEKLDSLIHEMKEAGIKCDAITFTVRLNAYAGTSDIQGMEKFLETMEADPDSETSVDWNTYAVLATAYLRAGLPEKTLAMLRKSEGLVGSSSRRQAYEIYITLYASLGNKDEVYRVWGLYRTLGKFCNTSYLCMISSLVKLDDIEGAERIWKEWNTGKTSFDKRFPNFMITACAKMGLWEKAEMYFDKFKENGRKPDASSWERLAMAYYKGHQKDKLAESLKQAILESKPGWVPRYHTFTRYLQYLRGEGGDEVAEQLLMLVKEHCHWSEETCKRLMGDIPRSNDDQRLEWKTLALAVLKGEHS